MMNTLQGNKDKNEVLKAISGLDMRWTPEGTLTFGDTLFVDEVAARPLERLRQVALDPQACVPPDRPLYWMYNGIGPSTQRAAVQQSGLRYELTLMFPNDVGRERAKTLGHYHAVYPKDELGYPEIIEVLHGEGYFYFFNLDWHAHASDFCLATLAKTGDKLIIPPNLFHGAMVAGDEPLLFADLLPSDINPVYKRVAQMGGMAHMLTRTEGWIANPRYSRVGKLNIAHAQEYPVLGLTRDRPLYTYFVEYPERLQWLRHPDQFPQIAPEFWQNIKEHVCHERIVGEPE